MIEHRNPGAEQKSECDSTNPNDHNLNFTEFNASSDDSETLLPASFLLFCILGSYFTTNVLPILYYPFFLLMAGIFCIYSFLYERFIIETLLLGMVILLLRIVSWGV